MKTLNVGMIGLQVHEQDPFERVAPGRQVIRGDRPARAPLALDQTLILWHAH